MRLGTDMFFLVPVDLGQRITFLEYSICTRVPCVPQILAAGRISNNDEVVRPVHAVYTLLPLISLALMDRYRQDPAPRLVKRLQERDEIHAAARRVQR